MPVMPFDLDVRPFMDGKYIVPKTVDYIKRKAATKKPFFVYVGYSEMHPPIIGHPDFVAKSTERSGLFADVLAEMDHRVGQIMDAIKEAGCDDNTIVILGSDNGGGGAIPQVGPGSNGPWRGDFFHTPFEGSHRVPGMIRWPGNVPAGVVTQEMLPWSTGSLRSLEWSAHQTWYPRIVPSTASTPPLSCWARVRQPVAIPTCFSV